MSTIAKIAEREAEEAEAELEEDAEAEQDTDAEEVEQPPAPATGEPTDKQLQAVDRENQRHGKRVHEIMGGFMEGFEPCAQCGTLGFTPPGPTLRSNSMFIACETCNGFGQVLTGSRSQQHATRDCPGCGGTGFLQKQEPPAPVGTASAATPVTAPEYGRATWLGDPTIVPSGAAHA